MENILKFPPCLIFFAIIFVKETASPNDHNRGRASLDEKERKNLGVAEKTAIKQRGRPFPKGVSGNSQGRPQGALNMTTRAAQTILDSEGEALTRKAVALAQGAR
jgi:hypothetical protein